MLHVHFCVLHTLGSINQYWNIVFVCYLYDLSNWINCSQNVGNMSNRNKLSARSDELFQLIE